MKKTETKSTVLLQYHLKTLKLPTMLAEHEKVAARCAADNADHLAFLLQLCELELIDRDRRAADRRLKSACFPNHKTLDAFDFKAQPSLNKVLITELMRGEYIDKRENILLVGNSGTGKTHVATALGIAACGHGRRVRFFQVTELITQLMEAREERVLMRLRKQLSKLDLLILDELGYVPASKVGSELLFDVISTAYERNSLIVTTNLPFENWTEVLSSERLTGATLDRLTHRCHILEASGECYRLRDAKRRKRPVRSSRDDTKTKQERPTPGHETPVTLNQDTTTNTALCYPTAPPPPPALRSHRRMQLTGAVYNFTARILRRALCFLTAVYRFRSYVPTLWRVPFERGP